MTPQRISTQLLNELDALIDAVQDNPVLTQGLQRERERLLLHLQLTVEPWLQSHGLDDPQVPRRSARCKVAQGERAYRRWRIQNARQQRSRRRVCSSLREACYLALAAEIIDGHQFDRLHLLSQRALRLDNVSLLRLDQASSSSPSTGLGSIGTRSGVCFSGSISGSVGRAGTSPERPSRTYRSSVSTMRAWA